LIFTPCFWSCQDLARQVFSGTRSVREVSPLERGLALSRSNAILDVGTNDGRSTIASAAFRRERLQRTSLACFGAPWVQRTWPRMPATARPASGRATRTDPTVSHTCVKDENQCEAASHVSSSHTPSQGPGALGPCSRVKKAPRIYPRTRHPPSDCRGRHGLRCGGGSRGLRGEREGAFCEGGPSRAPDSHGETPHQRESRVEKFGDLPFFRGDSPLATRISSGLTSQPDRCTDAYFATWACFRSRFGPARFIFAEIPSPLSS
jgi:hypothetical protein